jgi:hypothetical protein
MTITDKQEISFLQYLNTAILTMIGIVAIFIFVSVKDVKEQQAVFQTELIRIKTIQDINTTNISEINSRVSALEKSDMLQLQGWVDANYVRKKQNP